MALFIALIMFGISCYIISTKNRGFGFCILAFINPLIGLIVACCLKRKEKELTPDPSNFNIEPNTSDFDITNEDK